MPNIHDRPPPAIQADLNALSRHLNTTISAKMLDRNLLIATWNIRGFGSLTREWTATTQDSPLNAGYVDFMPFVYRDQALSRNAISHRVSDHYPLWAEFGVV